MNSNELMALISAISALITVSAAAYSQMKRTKPEIEKLERESDSEFAEANLQTMEGAKISMELLQRTVTKLQDDITAEKEARKKDVEYFRRRIREMDKENREYRLWAAKLVKQVIGAGLIPVPFEPIQETDPSIQAVVEPKDTK